MSAMVNPDQLWEVPAPAAIGMQMTEWWRRAAALVVDIAVVWIPLAFATRDTGRVRNAATGGPLGVAKAAPRSLAPTLLFLIPILGMLPWVADGVSALWDSRRQTVHDKLAGSVVVSAR